MKSSDMLNQMCHRMLAGTDIKALCKARGFPPEAASAPGILETLFLSQQGLSNVLGALDSKEIALLFMLKSVQAPVDVAFFSRAYSGSHSHGTFNQRFQNVFTKVKQRLVRNGLLLWAEEHQRAWDKKSRMERWRFALPAEFHAHLPPLITSPRQFEGDGDWRPNVARDKLSEDLGRLRKKAGKDIIRMEADELRLGDTAFKAARLIDWQRSSWRQELPNRKKAESKVWRSKQPDEAVLSILSELREGQWAQAEQLTECLHVFCGVKIDGQAVCQAGWKWGLLAKRQADGKTWYRLAPKAAPVAPRHYLDAGDPVGSVAVDLTSIPLEALEQIVAISDQRLKTAKTLLVTPNLVKLGRGDETLLDAEPVQWLIKNTQPFAEAFVKLDERRGKTILHENVTIARVSDLSLKVAIEKALGQNLVTLKNDYVAFPDGLLDDVQRVVKKSGHVVKEVTAK